MIAGAECSKISAITGLICPFTGAIFKLPEDELSICETHHDGRKIGHFEIPNCRRNAVSLKRIKNIVQ